MDIRTKQKLELLQNITPYLVGILFVTMGEVITFYKIDTNPYRIPETKHPRLLRRWVLFTN